MTTETIAIAIPTREQLEALVASANTELATAQTTANAKVAEIMGKQPIDFIALGAASQPVETATSKVTKAQTALDEFLRTSKWESSEALRKPLLDTIHLIADSKPSVAIRRIYGTLKISHEAVLAEDGTPTGQTADVLGGDLKVTLDGFDTKALLAMFAEQVDASALLAQDVTSIDVDVSGIGTPSGVSIKLLPTPAGSTGSFKTSSETKREAGTGSGGWEYEYPAGTWLSASDFLDTIKAEGTEAYTKYQSNKGWEPSGNGRSNLARDTAKRLGVASRQKE